MASIVVPVVSKETYEKFLKGLADAGWTDFDPFYSKRLRFDRMKREGLIPIHFRKEPTNETP